ncbi:carboxylesterase/lipase family protein [Phenylobacterium sp.]|jgi:para-nitrobenzyl esterase|uniref:carboxylesterase/lipase family protein n=1 Tax=Phenylobacterium sp. TaxID=1871053 RepID=UPI002F931A39
MSKTMLPLVGAAIVLSACATAPSGPGAGAAGGEVVQTRLGAVRGETVSDVGATARIFRGIPYAAPPVGPLRWKPPQPAQAWSGVRDATGWPNRCPQGESSMGAATPLSEDCLYLNVVTPARSPGARLPVMVFYHGGGLTTGTSSSTTYNHPKLPSQGVVVVTANSRLGPLGYLAHPALAAEGRGSGNFGTLDIRASLEWVRDNIAAFGGDPNNVTIFGESGGGTKVISQMASPLSRGLFHKAIVESGSALVSAQRTTTRQTAEARGAALARALGADGANPLAAMRAASWQDVIAAAAKAEFSANVVVDGEVIPAPVHEIFKAGRQAKVPLIVGANTGEASLRRDVPEMANLHSAAGGPTWVYNFSQLPLGWRQEKGCVAFHGLELSYVFGAIPVGLSSPTTLFLARGGGCSQKTPAHDEQDMRVADQASRIWAQFAKTGNPSVPGLIEWPRYTQASNVYLDIGTPLAAKRGIESAYVAPPAAAAGR